MRLGIYAIAFGALLAGVLFAAGFFLFMLIFSPGVLLLLLGFWLYWKKLEMFCPGCGRRSSKDEGHYCPVDGTELKHLA